MCALGDAMAGPCGGGLASDPSGPLAPRMMLTVHLFQTLASHVCVDLCSRQITVTQEHLHYAEVRAVIEKMRGKGVSQRVRRKLFGNTGFTRVALDDVFDSLARHAVAPPRREEVVSLALEQNLTARAVEELGQPAHRLFAQGNQPLAVALAHDANDTLVDVALPMTQVDELGHPQPRCIQNLEHRPVPVAERIAHDRGRQQRLDFFLSQRLRKRTPDLRHGDLCRGILADHTLANEVAEESAEAGELTCRRARSRTGMYTPGNKVLEIGAGGSHHGDAPLRQPTRERSQICAIGCQSVWRRPAFQPYGVEELGYSRIGGIGTGRHGDCSSLLRQNPISLETRERHPAALIWTGPLL